MELNKSKSDEVLGKYTNRALIGTGSNGSRVYRVENTKDNKIYAMKKILINQTGEEEPYKNEIKIFKSLNHPNIIKFYESFIRKNKLYIIMEYAERGDVRSVIKKQILNNNEYVEEVLVWKWFTQIASAVKYLHSKKIIHRDIKVENIFITGDNNVKLGDFGVSKELETTMELANSGVGTPYYLSPEICQGFKYNFKTDIWMLGCFLYEICTLNKPFKADSIKVLIKSIIQKDPDAVLNTKYSDNLITLINSMLKKQPEERPSIEEVWIRICLFSKANISHHVKLIDKNKLQIEVEEESSENSDNTESITPNNCKLTPISLAEIDFRKKMDNQFIQENVNKTKYTPVHCKNDISKIMKNMQISPLSSAIENDPRKRNTLTTANSTPTNVPQTEVRYTPSSAFNKGNTSTGKNFGNRHYRHISINISSIQSPEHKATYQIDNIEKVDKLEFPSPIHSNFPQSSSNVKIMNYNKQTSTPTNCFQADKISTKEQLLKEIPNTSQIGKAECSMIRKSLVKSFLIERYTEKKFEYMYNNIMETNQINEKRIKEIVGDDYRVAINYLKYLTGKK